MVDRAAAALAAVEAVLKDADAGPRRKQQGRAGEGNKPEWASGARLSMKPKKVGRMEGPEVKASEWWGGALEVWGGLMGGRKSL